MKAMILAAGLGTRLRPLTDTCPKPLLPLMLQPMLGHVLEQLRQQDVREVVINLHQQAAQLGQWLGDGQRWGLLLHLSYEPEILGTAGGIKQAEPWLRDAPFLVLNADVLIDLDLRAVWQWHCQHGAMVTMVVRPDPAAREYGAVIVDAADRVLHINGRPTVTAQAIGQETVFTGIQVMAPEVLEHIPPGRSISTTADVYPALLVQHQAVYGYCHTGYWMDVGVPERYLQAHWDMLDGVLGHQWIERLPPGSQVVLQSGLPLYTPSLPSSPLPAPAGRGSNIMGTIAPPVVFGPGVVLAPGARVGPYAVLGTGCQVEAGAVVRHSVLWEGVQVAVKAQVHQCILGTSVHVHTASILHHAVRSM
jgi:NDP-sugar pyrophosphorylase family protein